MKLSNNEIFTTFYLLRRIQMIATTMRSSIKVKILFPRMEIRAERGLFWQTVFFNGVPVSWIFRYASIFLLSLRDRVK